ncbi:endopeptidase La [candidate division TM6 bacterium RIFCSPHIGHO2_12_FULL_38_8]|nr:MAG: endopeptidase La [candidate division TM6 bacterium RIFCSPHIGHO2_12_FULL_38_8]
MEVNLKQEHSLDTIPKIIPVVPTINVTVFPNMIMPLLVLDDRIMNGIKQATQTKNYVLLLSAQESSQEGQEIDTDNLYSIGTIASVMRVINVPDDGIKVLVQGVMRASVQDLMVRDDMLLAEIKPLKFNQEITDSTQALIKNIKEVAEQLSMTSQTITPDFYAILAKMHEPEKIAEFVLSHLEVKSDAAQALLECKNVDDLLKGIYEELSKEISVVQVQERIRNSTRESINKSQHEYYLREQLKAIKKELGEDLVDEIEGLKLQLAEKKMSEKIKKEIEKQIDKLERIAPESMEATVTRNHIELLLALPWGQLTKDNLNLAHAKEVLDKDHYGLEDVKERILDFISIKNLKADGPSPILCLYGPPGVGKTSLGQSIAKALGRNFYRISLGGVKDESEIRGHRKTYVGAMPGRIIHAMRKANSMNPVILIDEIDKLGADFRGDPSAALLEVLDPNQNKEFYDNYVGLPFDLSNVMFILTCNDIGTMSAPLLDRMEIIQLSGYTFEEKYQIAKKYLIKQAVLEAGLKEGDIALGKSVLDTMIYEYTREAGVRHLAQIIKRLCAKAARSYVEHKKTIKISNKNLEQFLGPKKYPAERFERRNMIGITNGLAWTSVGGEVMKIESILMPGTGKLILTGHLGDVMKESAQAAVSYARSHAGEFDIAQDKFTLYDLHVHLPAGAVPKDGPSAGISILSSILSTLTGRPIDASFAMTGELNLRGEVMPIGGLKEKVLAAKRNNLLTVILPEDNRNDWNSIKDIVEDLNIVWVKHANEVMDYVLMPLVTVPIK